MIQLDDAMVVAHIHHQEGTRTLAMETGRKDSVSGRTSQSSFIVDFPVDNWRAYFFGLQHLDSRDWALHPEVFLKTSVTGGGWHMWTL